MSDVDLPDAAADLLDVDEDDFATDEALREYVDEKLAEILAAADERDDRLDDHDDRLRDLDGLTGALSRRTERALDAAERAEERAEDAEQMAAWGGIGYEERLQTVVNELLTRARRNEGAAHITTSEEDCEDMQGNRYTRPGIHDLFDGAVSERTCRNYIDDLGEIEGMSAVESQAGGWNGGREQKRLRMHLPTFLDAHGDGDTFDVEAALSGGVECDHCGDTFDTQDGLDEHVALFHSEEVDDGR